MLNWVRGQSAHLFGGIIAKITGYITVGSFMQGNREQDGNCVDCDRLDNLVGIIHNWILSEGLSYLARRLTGGRLAKERNSEAEGGAVAAAAPDQFRLVAGQVHHGGWLKPAGAAVDH